MNNNVLVSCGGKWVGMVLQLKRTMREVPLLRDAELIVADNATLTPAGCFADRTVVVPRIADETYIDALLEICQKHHVKILVPLIDIDLIRLSPHLPLFEAIGTIVICPSEPLVNLCMDKLLFEGFVRAASLPYPVTYRFEELTESSFPLFAKRKLGFGSVGAFTCRSLLEAEQALERFPDLIFQELIQAPEVSVDAYISRMGRCIIRVQRIRDKILGGEVFQSHTTKLEIVAELASRTIDALATRGLRGPLNVQLFLGERPSLIEVNTRLGSGSVLSNMATEGGFFRSLLSEALGESCDGDPNDYMENLQLYRYWGDVFSRNSEPLAIFPSIDSPAN